MWLAEKRYLLGKLDPQSVSLIYPKVGPFQSFCLTYSTTSPDRASSPSPSPSGLARSNTSLPPLERP